jgi:single-stranded-DNA-specific exonuclease
VTDHHTPPTEERDLPEAFAVVHPRRHGSAYPFGELSGSAVAFKVAWRLATLSCGSGRVPAATREVLLDMLALASLGVIADVVPLRGENRVIARFGLSRLRHVANTGLRALIAASGLDGENVGEFDVGFKLGPRLNACGRLGHAKEAVELLTIASAGRAAEIADQLSALNTERRAVEKRIAEQAADMARACGMDGEGRRAIVLAHEEWHAGVVGIACSRLVGLFHRPTILMHRDAAAGECHGSGRSIDGFNLHAALEACKSHLIAFGGHDMAAGVRVRAENVAPFAEAFTAVANDRLAAEDLVASVTFDTEATLEELTLDAVRELERLAPFGRENPPPRVLLRGVRVEGRPRVIGKTGEHASLFVKAPAGRASVQFPRSLRLVGWGWAARLAGMPVGATIDAVIEPKMSAWNGVGNVEGEMVDIRVQG